MYEDYYGLSTSPFRLTVDPQFFFGSKSHNKAMAYLHYGVKQAEGFIVITGPVGAGKTMLISQLLDQLSASNIVAAQLLTANIQPADLLSRVLSAFCIEPSDEGSAAELEAFEDFLFDQLRSGKRVLLIVDEAQNLLQETLEELRMLSNIDYDGTPLFQIFLIGQPEFRDMLDQPSMQQLQQRIIASHHLEDLSKRETHDYIAHRLSVAGWRKDPVFTDKSVDAIFAETNGRPRCINTLCNRILLYCALEKRHDVTVEVVATVLKELEGEQLSQTRDDVQGAPHDRELDNSAGENSNSVFDRLKRKRASLSYSADKDAPNSERAECLHQPATLSDVASAIQSATVAQAEGIVQVFDPDDQGSEHTKADNSHRSEKVASFAIKSALAEVRAELKQVHSRSLSLQRILNLRQERQVEKHTLAATKLDNAVSLLDSCSDR